MTTRVLSALATTALLACSGGQKADSAADVGITPAAERADCDPTAPTLCGLPFPSTFYMAEDATSATGWRIDLGPTTLPEDIDGFQPAPTFWNEKDGWAVSTPMLVHLPNIDVTNLPGHDRIPDSLAPDSPIAVIDADTGERVAFWAERDVSYEDGERSLLLIHPAGPFDYGHRYVVGIRDVVDTSGTDIAPSEAFVALRDNTLTGDADTDAQLERRRDYYDTDIFGVLEAEGWSRSELVIAWDFVTMSHTQATGRAATIRDMTLAWLPEDGPQYTIVEIEEAPREGIAYYVHGEVTAPLFTELDRPDTLLLRDDNGEPMIGGEAPARFTAVVPQSVVDAAQPAPVVQYGHGLLGHHNEVESGYLAEMASREGWILFAMTWSGMAGEDQGAIAVMVAGDLGRFAIIPERSQQGFAEFHTGLRAFKTSLVEDEAFRVADPSGDGTVPLIDPTRTYYYGNSQGGILGGAYAAISNDIERAVLGVGGGPYHLLLNRSKDFEPFFLIFQTKYPDAAQIGLWLGYMQTLWDEAEGSAYARTYNAEPVAGTQPTHVLQQVAIGDNQVTTLGAEFLARGHNAVFVGEPVREVWGIDTVADPTTRNVLVEWDYGVPEPYTNTPPQSPDPHEWPRRELAAQQQMAHFFATGEILDFCDGPCTDYSRTE